MVLAGISSLYTAALIAAWGIGILYLFASRATAHSIVPLLIWSYGVASGPWSFLASKDQQGGGNRYSAMSTFFFQVGYVVAIALILMSRSLAPAVLALTAAMGVDWLLEMCFMRAQMHAEALLRGTASRRQGYTMQLTSDAELDAMKKKYEEGL